MSSNTSGAFVVPKHSAYSGLNGAIEFSVRVFAKDCGNKKITVNAVAPGGTVTDMFDVVAPNYIPNSENLSGAKIENANRVKCVTSWRLMHWPSFVAASTIDITDVVCFLASKEGE